MKDFIIVITSAIIGVLISILIFLTMQPMVLINQPYHLTVDKITPELRIMCIKDENCMDLELLEDKCKGDK